MEFNLSIVLLFLAYVELDADTHFMGTRAHRGLEVVIRCKYAKGLILDFSLTFARFSATDRFLSLVPGIGLLRSQNTIAVKWIELAKIASPTGFSAAIKVEPETHR